MLYYIIKQSIIYLYIKVIEKTNMYESLLRLPYFQGMSKDELTQILDKVKLDFISTTNGESIVRQGEKCNRFIILLKGFFTAETLSEDGSYKLTELIEAPYALEPYSLFGRSTDYKRGYTAKGEGSILGIDKSYFYSDFMKRNIFTINLLNLICHKTQLLSRITWEDAPECIEGKIARFIAQRSETLSGQKHLTIRMEQLASQLHETRINISRALNSLQQKGLVELSRKEINIPSFEKLLQESWQISMHKSSIYIP